MITKTGFADESFAFALAFGLVEFTEADRDRNAERRSARLRRDRHRAKAR